MAYYTGYKIWITRKLRFSDGDQADTGVTEDNTEFLPDGTTPDPNYMPKEIESECPLGGIGLQEIDMTGSPSLTLANACVNTTHTTRWHDGDNIGPVPGDIVYADIGGVTPFDGASLYWKCFDSNTSHQIVNTGVVTSINACGLP